MMTIMIRWDVKRVCNISNCVVSNFDSIMDNLEARSAFSSLSWRDCHASKNNFRIISLICVDTSPFLSLYSLASRS